MSEKVRLTAEEIKKISDHMKSVMKMSSDAREVFIAMTIGEVYDVELPVPEVIESISRVARAGNRPEDNHVYYLIPTNIDKKVFTLTSNCNVTQVQVTPNTRTELTFTDLVSPDFWVCLKDFLTGDHDALQFYADSINEAMDRQEIYAVLQLLEAGVTDTGNTHTTESGETELTYPVLVNMVRSLAKYGSKFVLISGANVTTDIMLMDFNANTFRQYGLENLRIQLMPIETQTVDVNGSGQEAIIDADTAYLVAVSDSKGNKPVLFARRKVSIAGDMADTTVVAKERLIFDTGNIKNIGATVKFARGKAGYEEYGAVLINKYTIAKFTK